MRCRENAVNHLHVLGIALVAALQSLFVVGAAAQPAGGAESDGRCFEIIAPQRHAEPASPILFDKCSGRTWMLVRRHGGGRHWHNAGYRWVSLARDGAGLPAQAVAPAPAVVSKSPRPGGRNCFVFTGRRFCE
jgi:hypothetical protein